MKKVLAIIAFIALAAVIGIGAAFYFTQKNAPADATITEAEAQQIALDDAGLKGDAVTFTHTVLEHDDLQKHYDLKFYSTKNETTTYYDYEIDAESGAIVSKEAKERHSDPGLAPADGTTTQPAASGELTADEAKAIALQHANVTESDVRYVDVDRDRDNGVSVWSVEFDTATTEYDYEINMTDGSIVKAENEARGH